MAETTDTGTEPINEPPVRMDPVRRWTLIVAGLFAALLIWYLVANRHTPFTSQARVNAFVVPVAPDVGGRVISVEVANNALVVDQGDSPRLFCESLLGTELSWIGATPAGLKNGLPL